MPRPQAWGSPSRGTPGRSQGPVRPSGTATWLPTRQVFCPCLPGFSYKFVAQSGITHMSDGANTPSDPDGAGIFASSTGSTLVNNHEIASARPTTAEPDGVPA